MRRLHIATYIGCILMEIAPARCLIEIEYSFGTYTREEGKGMGVSEGGRESRRMERE